MKRLLLTTALMLACSGAYAKTCSTASGTVTTGPATDANQLMFYTGNCSSDNQANDGDDLKMFITKITTTTSSVDGSLDKNSSATIDQNFFIQSAGGAGFTSFTDGNGFANIKSSDDLTTSFTIDPLNPSDYDGTKFVFPGFDGMLFRGQLAVTTGGTGHHDTATITELVKLSDGDTIKYTTPVIDLTADFGVLGFDETGKLAAGVFVDSVTVSVSAGYSFDQLKQIEFSIPGATAPPVPEPSTWAMCIAGFGLLGFFGWRSRRSQALA